MRYLQTLYVFSPFPSQEELTRPRILNHHSRTRDSFTVRGQRTRNVGKDEFTGSPLERARAEGSGFDVHSPSVNKCLMVLGSDLAALSNWMMVNNESEAI